MKALRTFRLLSVILCAALAAALLFAFAGSRAGAAGGLPFTDVKETDWFFDTVKYCYENKLVNGTSATRFEPETNLTRAMFVTLLFRLDGGGGEYPCDFPDVPAGEWFTSPAGWAKSRGIVLGYTDGTFGPDNKITRQELATMIARYLTFAWAELEADGSAPASFTDAGDIADWAAAGFDRVRALGIVKGDPSGRANPEALATRAEAATMTARLHEALIGAGADPKIGGVPLGEFSLKGDPEMRPSELDDVRAVIKDRSGIEVPDAGEGAAHLIRIVEDESLARLSYRLEEKDGDLVLSLYSKFTVNMADEILEKEFSYRRNLTVPEGYSTVGAFELPSVYDTEGTFEYYGYTDKSPLSYKTGEKVTFKVSLLRGDRLVSVPYFSWRFENDDGVDVTADESGHTGQLILTFDGNRKPGTARLTVSAKSKKGYKISAIDVQFSGGVVYDFSAIGPNIPAPDDFDEFWDAALIEFERTEPEVLESFDVTSPSGYDHYSLNIKTGGDPAYVLISVPKNAEPNSLGISVGLGAYGVYSMGFSDDPRNITVNVNPHSIENLRDDAYYTEKSNELGAFEEGGATAKDSYFYGMLMRDVAAIRYAEKTFADLWNGVDISTSGGSMGGFQAVAVAGVYPKVNYVSTGVTWMCDLGGQTSGGTRIRGWRPEYNEATRYYDTVYFAHRVRGTVAVNAGLGDAICPPCGVAALYNALTSEKSVTWTQNRDHGYGGGKHGANYYLTGPDPVIAEDMREIVDTGSALPAPSYDENRELNDEEKALAEGCDAFRKSKIRRMTFANSSEIDGEYFRELIYSELTGTYGLPADITVEIDPDMLEDLRAEFRDQFSGGSVSAEFEYTVKLPSGSYYDSYLKVLFFKS